MKLLVFAHKPPPHHGQSYMVELLLQAFGGDAREAARTKNPPAKAELIECYHVDCRLSDGLADIGKVRWEKLWRMFRYCLQAISCRWRFGVKNFFYIPAPPMRAAIYRDWLVLALCRPFFRRRIFYWQAAGLGDWLVKDAHPWERWLTRGLLGEPDLSIVLGESCRSDALALRSRQTEVIPNGVPDPCPEFDRDVLPLRLQRAATRRALLSGAPLAGAAEAASAEVRCFNVLFLSLCTREKGLFDAVEAVALINQRLARNHSPLRVRLNIAGKFWREPERKEFEERVARPDLNGGIGPSSVGAVRDCGFVTGEEKKRLFLGSDCFCFPSYYQAESFGIVLIEAMAFGLPIITTRWRTIPELLPPGYRGMVEPRSPEEIAALLQELLARAYDASLRARFLDRYTDRTCTDRLKAVLTASLA